MKKRIFLISLFVLGLVFTSLVLSNPDNEVLKAFELRKNGKVEDSRALLENILRKDSTNAMACYEMARLNHYLLISGQGIATMDDILKPINRAVSLDPQNVIYAYFKAIADFLSAFMSMQTGTGEVKKKIDETCTQLKKVLLMKPDYHEAALYLVEIYGLLPKDMGGDSLQAIAYAEQLASENDYFGSCARAALLPKDSDHVKFWMERLDRDKDNPDLLMEVGKAYLGSEDPTNAEHYFEQAIGIDPSRNTLLLDLAGYHLMVVLQNKDLAAKQLPLANASYEKYLNTYPEPIVPLKAYAMGFRSLSDRILGNQAGADKWEREARKLDKYFCKATGMPALLLFDAPDVVCHHYFSFFAPY